MDENVDPLLVIYFMLFIFEEAGLLHGTDKTTVMSISLTFGWTQKPTLKTWLSALSDDPTELCG